MCQNFINMQAMNDTHSPKSNIVSLGLRIVAEIPRNQEKREERVSAFISSFTI